MDLSPILADRNPWWARPERRLPAPERRRRLQPEVKERLLRPGSRRATVILGPRQTGKTVLLKQVARDLLDGGWPAHNLTYFDFSDERLIGSVGPRDVVGRYSAGADPSLSHVYLLDEIGSGGDWPRWLKQEVDHSTPGAHRIAATDSSAVILRAGGRESGLGRWDELQMEPMTFLEALALQGLAPEESWDVAPDPFDVFLQGGGFPEHVGGHRFEDIRGRLRADIADRAVLRDVQRTGIDLLRVRSLFAYLVQQSGAIFNASEVGNVLDTDRRVVGRWIQLLLDTMLLWELPQQVSRASQSLRSRPKVYAADHALVSAFSPSPDPLSDPHVLGRVFETAVFRELRELARSTLSELNYFRDRKGVEVDFILRTADHVVAVEVTSRSTVGKKRAIRVKRNAKAAGAERVLIVHGGLNETVDEFEGVTRVPLRRFLREPGRVLGGATG